MPTALRDIIGGGTEVGNAAPQPLGTAAAGASGLASRQDHVHAMPNAGQVGADPAGTAVAQRAAHEAAGDPHPQYLTNARGDARYGALAAANTWTANQAFDGAIARRTTGGGWMLLNNSPTNVTRGGIWADDDATRFVNELFNVQFIARVNGQAYITGQNVRVESGISTFGGQVFNQGRVEVIGANTGTNGGAIVATYLDDAKTIVPIAIGNVSAVLGGGHSNRGVIFSNTTSLDINANLVRVTNGTFECLTYAAFETNNAANLPISTAFGSVGGLEAVSAGTGAAFMSFHRPGAYAVHFGLDTDNQLKVGGWSMGAASYRIWHEGNSAQVQAGTSTGQVAIWNQTTGRYEPGAGGGGTSGIPVTEISANTTLSNATHLDRRLRKSNTVSLDVTAPSGLPIGFTCILRNANSTGVINVIRGSGVAVRIAGSATDANAIIDPWGDVLLSVEATGTIVLTGTGVRQ